MTKQIKVNLDEAKNREIFKKSFSRFQENMKIDDKRECGHAVCGCNITGHTPAEKKWINKMCVYVCVIAALVVFAGYALTPINWDILITK